MSLRLELDEELERRFRELAMRKFGYSKGSLLKASTVAVSQWVKQNEIKQTKSVKDPVSLLSGLLKGSTRKSSVELQHEATRIWAERAMHYKRRGK